MKHITDASTDPTPASQARLLRLASYQSLQRRLDCQRRQQISRQRLLALRSDTRFGWLPL